MAQDGPEAHRGRGERAPAMTDDHSWTAAPRRRKRGQGRMAEAMDNITSEVWNRGYARGLEAAAEIADDHAATWGAAMGSPATVIAQAIRQRKGTLNG